MPSSNQFKVLAPGSGANTLTPTAYAALTALLANGFQTGTASSQQINTIFRQTTFVAAAVAQLMADSLGAAVNDDGVVANFQLQLSNTIKALAATTIPAPSIPSGSRTVFNQAAAPTGWVQDGNDIANNRMMRVVAGAGGGTGGTYDPTYNNVLPSHTHTFTTDTRNINHVHYDSGHGHVDAGHGHVDAGHGHSDTGHSHSQPLQAGGYSGSAGVGNGALYPGTTGTGYANITSGNANIQNGAANITSGTANLGGMSGNQDHYHQGTTAGTGGGTWAPRFVDLIICVKS